MKNIFIIFLAILSSNCYAQKYIRPVFDRTDNYLFHIDSVKVTKDSTFLFFTYDAEGGSWANISDNTHIVDKESGKEYKAISVQGIPFHPAKRHFTYSGKTPVKVSFSSVSNTNHIDFIEKEKDSTAFNIWGINLNKSYNTTYSIKEYEYDYELSAQFDSLNNQDKAIQYKKLQLEKAKSLFGVRSIYVGSILYDLNLLCFQAKDYLAAIDYGEEAIDIIKGLPGSFAEDIARIQSSLLADYGIIKQFDRAVYHGQNSLNARRLLWGETPKLAVYLDYMARIFYYWLGNSSKALLYERECSEIFYQTYGEQSNEYIQSLINESVFLNDIGNKKEASNTAKKVVDIVIQKADSISSPLKVGVYHNYALTLLSQSAFVEHCLSTNKNMIMVLTLIGDIYRHNKDYTHSLDIYNKAMEMAFDLLGENNTSLADLYEKKGQVHKLLHQFDEAVCCDSTAMMIYKKVYGDDNISFAWGAIHYAEESFLNKMYFGKGNVDTISFYISKSANIIKRHLNSTMFCVPRTEREAYWNQYRSHFDDFIPAIAYFLDIDSINAIAYDAMLYSKGFKLNVECQLRTKVMGSPDASIHSAFKKYVQLLSARDQLLGLPLNERPSQAIYENQTKQIQTVEAKLVEDLNINGYSFNESQSWKDVQRTLSSDDIAIEFGAFNNTDGETLYYALVIKKNYGAPHIIRLFNESQLLSVVSDEHQLSDLIWAPLVEEIGTAKNVFFSPFGALNVIGIENLPFVQEREIDIYRCSSTKEICYQKEKIGWNKVALFGGLNYDSIEQGRNSFESTSDKEKTRGTYEPLIHTYDEVLSVDTILESHGMNCELYTGDKGNESALKALSGKPVNILHLATHGVFVEDEEVLTRSEELNYPFWDDGSHSEMDEMMLSRSFLLLSGGNKRIKRDRITITADDGYLTALEISRLDFKDLDVVVLSACKTASGEITNEGVYGLQRGFKMAGANTILMSLNQVDDEATKILMVEFYKNLMSGKSKLQSLKDAQKYLRQVEDGKYDDPKYWASFIMLDGLD